MITFPPANHPANELIDRAHVTQVVEQRCWANLREAVCTARKAFAEERALRRINLLVVTCDGVLRLMSFGPRGGRKTLWTFGAL